MSQFENEQFIRDLVKGMRLRAIQCVGEERPTDNHAREMYGDKYNLLQGLLKQALHETYEDYDR